MKKTRNGSYDSRERRREYPERGRPRMSSSSGGSRQHLEQQRRPPPPPRYYGGNQPPSRPKPPPSHAQAQGRNTRERSRSPDHDGEKERKEQERRARMARLRAENEEEEKKLAALDDPTGSVNGNSKTIPQPKDEFVQVNEEELEGLDEDEQMQRLLGFSGGFATTKGQEVEDNSKSAARGAAGKNKARKYRQYMNRKGGFNRPLDKMN